MGIWKTERGNGSDEWADQMDGLMSQLKGITLAEFADLVEFTTRGLLVVEVRPGVLPKMALAALHSDGQETFPNRGQVHCDSF